LDHTKSTKSTKRAKGKKSTTRDCGCKESHRSAACTEATAVTKAFLSALRALRVTHDSFALFVLFV